MKTVLSFFFLLKKKMQEAFFWEQNEEQSTPDLEGRSNERISKIHSKSKILWG